MSVKVLNEGYSDINSGFYIKKAQSCYLYDVHDKQYIDMAMAGGSALLGHAEPGIQAALQKQLSLGSLYTSPTPLAHAYAELLNKIIPQYQDFIFCSTGSEATMRAIRIAKAASGKQKIAIFSGCWHGSHDLLLFEEDYQYPLEAPHAKLKSQGTPPELLEHILLLPYNHQAALELIQENADKIAMVLIEPVQGSNPRNDIKPFLQQLRAMCNHNDMLLGFDEVITGGRLALGGGQQYFGVEADIATYGKALGGGLPIGIVAGTKKVMASIREKALFMGGTFSANPLSICAGMSMINSLINTSNIYLQLGENAQYFRHALNEFCIEHKINAHMMGVSSLSRLVFCKQKVASRRERDEKEVAWAKQADFYQLLKEHGVYIGGNRINFLSTEHTKDVIDKVIEAYKSCLLIWHKQGVI